MDAIYSFIEMRSQNCLLSPPPKSMLEICFMKMYSACGAIIRNSIICFFVEGPSYFNQSCLNLGLSFFSPLELFESFYLNLRCLFRP